MESTRQDPFHRIRALMHEVSGVSMNDTKRELVNSRVGKRVRALGLDGLEGYVELITGAEGKGELAIMVDLLTTNKTSFFREKAHFEFLRGQVLPPALTAGRPLRMWSAGCSSGEEPYSLAMTILDETRKARRPEVKILATDLSPTVVAQAREGVYGPEAMREVPAETVSRYFRPHAGERPGAYRIGEAPRSMVSFAGLNLMASWPMKGPFDLIMCRNVMIYFDRPTRSELIRRFTALLTPGGHLMVGHSESLNGLGHELAYVQPAVYRREG